MSNFSNKPITIYNKNTFFHDSLLTALKTTAESIWKNRWLIWVNFKKDFFSKYRQAGLGKLWSYIVPIIPITVYIFLGYLRVLNVRGGVPYVVFIASGVTFWALLAGGIRSVISAFQRDKGLLGKVNIPLVVVILSRYGEVCADTLIRFIFLIIVIVSYKIKIGFTILLLPLVIFPILLLNLGMGVILGIINVVNTDTENIVNILLTYGMWVSSVIFPMPEDGILGVITSFNIFNHLVVGCRDFIVFGRFNNPLEYFASSVICVLIFVISLKWQHAYQFKIKGIF